MIIAGRNLFIMKVIIGSFVAENVNTSILAINSMKQKPKSVLAVEKNLDQRKINCNIVAGNAINIISNLTVTVGIKGNVSGVERTIIQSKEINDIVQKIAGINGIANSKKLTSK